MQWLSRRGIASFGDVIGLPTLLLGAALFSYAFAVVLEGERRRIAWLALASVIFAGFLSTGTRSSVVLLAAPLAIVLGTRERLGRRSVRLFIVLPAAAILIAAGFQTVVRATGADREALSSRAQLLYQAGGRADVSYFERQTQSAAAWEIFQRYPITGGGAGYPITWVDAEGTTMSSATVDSPVAYLAKFGLLGLVPLVMLVWGFKASLTRMRERTRVPTIAQLGLIGFAGVVVAWSFLYVPFEDKGIPSGYLLLLALALSEPALRRARRGLTQADVASSAPVGTPTTCSKMVPANASVVFARANVSADAASNGMVSRRSTHSSSAARMPGGEEESIVRPSR